jgi:hypothetical protein
VVGDVGWTTDGGAEDLEAVVTKMAGAVGGGGVEEFSAEGEGDTFEDGGARSGEEDATLVGVEDETKRRSMLREEGEDESDIGKRRDAMGVVDKSHRVGEVGVWRVTCGGTMNQGRSECEEEAAQEKTRKERG